MGEIYGLIGEKLSHSLSPEIHKLILKKLNREGSYNLFQLKREDLELGLNGLRVLGAKGVNVTIPYKVDVMKHIDMLSEEANNIGAVNTISFIGGELKGYNTDYFGFRSALRFDGIEIRDRRFCILGTGGASRAVRQVLIDNKAVEIIFVSRKSQLTNLWGDRVISYGELSTIKGDIIINCTPCGMYPDINVSPVDVEILENFNTAIDLIYNPQETLFLKNAISRKLKTQNGLYMLVAQAVAAQEIWNNVKIDDYLIDEIYLELKKHLYGDENEKK